MDKYHIYEEIGKGEFSQVFKGREKKKIEYVAIKRVEKSMMSKVVIISYPFVIFSHRPLNLSSRVDKKANTSNFFLGCQRSPDYAQARKSSHFEISRLV